eukprot:201479-Amphidinium_carterae.1
MNRVRALGLPARIKARIIKSLYLRCLLGTHGAWGPPLEIRRFQLISTLFVCGSSLLALADRLGWVPDEAGVPIGKKILPESSAPSAVAS